MTIENFYSDISLKGNQLTNAELADVSIQTVDALPSSAEEGRIIIFNERFHLFSGNEWKEIIDSKEITQRIESAKQGLSPKAAVDYTTWANVEISESYRNISRPLSQEEIERVVPKYILIEDVDNPPYYNIDHRGEGLNNGQRILLKNQTNKRQNGIYIVEGSSTLGYRLVRTHDLDNDDPADNVYLFVKKGTPKIHEDIAFVQTNNNTKVGINDLVFDQFSSGAATELVGSASVQIVDKSITLVREGENAVTLKKDLARSENVLKDSIELIKIKDSILNDINSLGLPIVAEGIFKLSQFNDRHHQFNFLMKPCFSKILARVTSESSKILNTALSNIRTMDNEIYSNIFDAIKVNSFQAFQLHEVEGEWVNKNIAVVPYVTDQVEYIFYKHKLDEQGNPMWVDEENNIPVYEEEIDENGSLSKIPVSTAMYPIYINSKVNSGHDPMMKFVLTFSLESTNIFRDILNAGITLLEKNYKIESWAKFVFLDILKEEYGQENIQNFLDTEGIDGKLSEEHIEYAHQLSLEYTMANVIKLFAERYLLGYVPNNLLE